MTAFCVLKELTSQLSLAANGDDIGRALFGVSRRFGFTTAVVIDMTKVLGSMGPGIVFAAMDRTLAEGIAAKGSLLHHPLSVHAQASERPFVMSRLRVERGECEEEWRSLLPAYLQDKDGIVVPVHDEGAFAWYSSFAGREPDLSQCTLSVMSAAVHAGYARFKELLDATAGRSPLTPREGECLRWVADGKADAEIGIILKISPRTVRFHINNAKMKLGVATRIQAVAKRVSGAA